MAEVPESAREGSGALRSRKAKELGSHLWRLKGYPTYLDPPSTLKKGLCSFDLGIPRVYRGYLGGLGSSGFRV